MAQRSTHTGAPGHLYLLLEWRALLEIASLPLAWPFLATAAQGDGHPVLLLPGFMAREGTLVALKQFLNGKGYNVQAWGRRALFHQGGVQLRGLVLLGAGHSRQVA